LELSEELRLAQQSGSAPSLELGLAQQSDLKKARLSPVLDGPRKGGLLSRFLIQSLGLRLAK
jgi:hypothetical protein